MKKIYLCVLAAFVLFASGLFLVGCGSENTSVENNIADIRYGVFDGTNNGILATVIYGEREEPYKADGNSNNLVPFAIISLSFKEKQTEKTFEFKLVDGEKTYSGTLEKSPYTSEFMADIGSLISSGDNLTLSILVKDSPIEISLENKAKNWPINHEKALNIGKNALSEEIKDLQKQGKCEYYLKIISDNKSNFGTYFWAFTVISETGSKHNVVFSPHSDTILVKN